MTPREEILGRIRAAVDGMPPRPVPRDYRRSQDADAADRVARLTERLDALNVTVLPAREADVAEIAGRRLAEKCIGSLLIPPDLPPDWRPASPELVEDAGQGPCELDKIQGTMTGCAMAIAETGTIVLDAGVAQGRRAITLVPDYYLCVIRVEQVVSIVSEAIARLQGAAGEGRPITFISGPSATADIELSRVVGVHGPRTLDVILVA